MSQFIPYDFVNWTIRLLLAQGVIIGFLLLGIVSFSLPHAGEFKPFFLLMAVYYWAVYRPTVMPVGYTFALGLIMDLLTYMPVGFNALVLVALQTLARRSRLFLMGQPYLTVWLGFAVMALGYAMASWLVLSISSSVLLPLTPILVAAGFSILIFPLASLLLLTIHRLLPMTSTPLHSVG